MYFGQRAQEKGNKNVITTCLDSIKAEAGSNYAREHFLNVFSSVLGDRRNKDFFLIKEKASISNTDMN